MPGIFGIVDPAAHGELRNKAAQKMAQSLLHYPRYQWAVKQSSAATMGVVHLGITSWQQACSVVSSADGRYQLAFEGELFNVAELQHALAGDQEEDSMPASPLHFVLHLLIRSGPAALPRFNGLFQLAFWDNLKQQLLLAGDRIGLRSLYLAHQGERLAFAPEVKALLTLPWVSRAIDTNGVMQFLQYGNVLGDRTFFREVQFLPGGCYAIHHRGRLSIARYWGINFEGESKLELKTAQERFVELWQQVIRRQTEDVGRLRMGVLLSGGLDSRLILSGCVAQGRKLPTFTMGDPESLDVRLAKKTATAAECRNLFVPIAAESFLQGLERVVYLTDGMFNCFHAKVKHLFPSLATNADVVLEGLSPIDNFFSKRRLLLAKWFLHNDPYLWFHDRFVHNNIFAIPVKPHVRLNLIDPSLRPLCDCARPHRDLDSLVCCESCPNAGPTQFLDRFFFYHRIPRFAAFGSRLLRTVAEVRCPYFDKEVLEFATHLSPDHRSGDKLLQKHAIGLLTPALAEIPWERSGVPLNASRLQTDLAVGRKYVREQSYEFLEHRCKISIKSLRPDKLLDLDEMLRSAPVLQEYLRSQLLDQPQLSGIFDRPTLRTLFERHLSRAGNHADLLGRVLTVETWHRLFVRNTVAQDVPLAAESECASPAVAGMPLA